MTGPRQLPRLMVAPNGARRSKADHPALPVTLAETVATAKACHAAGADGIHLHVRDSKGRHSLDVGLYREAIAALQREVPGLFVQVTSEAAGLYDAEAQRNMIRELQPRSVSVALREMLCSPTEEHHAAAFFAWARGEGIDVQHIVYSPRELDWLLNCIETGAIPGARHQVQLVLGSYAEDDLPRPSDLEAYLGIIEKAGSDLAFDWMVCAFGSAETACLAYAAARCGKVRVGFENSLWNADGTLARDNAQRVREVRRAVERAVQTLSPVDR